MKIAGLK